MKEIQKSVLLEGKDITKSFSQGYKSTKVLDRIDIEIYEGDFTVIMGSSGAGKSTLLYNLSGMDRPSGGSVFFRGKDITSCTERQMADLRADEYKIVGVVDCEHNMICGTPSSDDAEGYSLFIFSEGIEDLQAELKEIGLEMTEKDVYWTDVRTQKKAYQEDLVDVIDSSSQIIYIGIVVLMCIALVIIYTTFLRDRHSEWCLYASIGFSGKAIYYSILRELLFTFAVCL